jgi:hypothetical protein
MKSSKRLAILSLIIMALVSTPRAVQQLRHSINAAQERAGLVWWNLLLTPEAQAAEKTNAPLNPCPRPQLIAANANKTGANNPAPALRNETRPAPAARPALDARTAHGDSAANLPAGPEIASNDYSTQGAFDSIGTPARFVTPAEMPQKLASHTASTPTGSVWTTEKIQSALASLNRNDAPLAPPDIHILSDISANEFTASPSMNALLSALAKRNINVQFRTKKALDRNQFPRTRARTLTGKDADALPLPRGAACECPAGSEATLE